MRFTEDQIGRMAEPISVSEDEKCQRAIRMVRDAMKKLNYSDNGLRIQPLAEDTYAYALDLRQDRTGRRLSLLVQGSYANKTNIPTESDVDVSVIQQEPLLAQSHSALSYCDLTALSPLSLKSEVERALRPYFGAEKVKRHNKCLTANGNSGRVEIDVVPAYRLAGYPNVKGIEILTDKGERIVNYPEEHIKNGVEKNKETKYRFKKCVRIAKNLREEMKDANYRIPDEISSFGLESLWWNIAPNVYTRPERLAAAFDQTLSVLSAEVSRFGTCKEANGIKPLFPASEPAKLQAYVKFIKDMRDFFTLVP